MRFQVRQNMQPVLSAGKMLVTQDAFGFAFNWLKKVCSLGLLNRIRRNC